MNRELGLEDSNQTFPAGAGHCWIHPQEGHILSTVT